MAGGKSKMVGYTQGDPEPDTPRPA